MTDCNTAPRAGCHRIEQGTRSKPARRRQTWWDAAVERGGMRRRDAGVGGAMARPVALIGIVLLGSSPACMPPEGAPTPAPSPSAEPTSEPTTPEGPLELTLDGGPLGPPGPQLSGSGTGHAEHTGWTPDGRFGHCHARAADCYECRWVAQDGSAESLESGSGCGEGVERAQLDARLAEGMSPGPERWSWGSTVVLVVETREEEVTNAGQPRPMLKLGARPREGGPVAWMLHVDPCEGCGTDQVCDGNAHLDALTLSPDGQELLALVHGRGNDGSESMRLERLSAARVAEAALTPASRAAP